MRHLQVRLHRPIYLLTPDYVSIFMIYGISRLDIQYSILDNLRGELRYMSRCVHLELKTATERSTNKTEAHGHSYTCYQTYLGLCTAQCLSPLAMIGFGTVLLN